MPIAFDAMGCRFESLIGVERSGLTHTECMAIGEEIREIVLDWHARLSVFESGSVVSRINRTKAHESIAVDDEMYALLLICDHLRIQTKGAFNIAAGTLMEANGFRNEHIEDLNGVSLDQAFTLDDSNRTLTKADERIRLDFGALAKGYVLDLIRSELEEQGIADAFVHGGTSSSIALGVGADGDEWNVDLGHDIHVVLSGLSLAVSEINGRTVVSEGNSIGHVMNPMTMTSANGSVQRVACIHQCAALSDALSTACSVSADLIDDLMVQSDDNLCTLVIFEDGKSPMVHDPLGVVLSKG